MIGEQYWATGITLRPGLYGKWAGIVRFYDDGYFQNRSTEGEIRTRYFCPSIEIAIDTCKEEAERLDIRWGATPGDTPWLLIEQDGKSEEWPPPIDWREVLIEQAKRLGWQTYDYPQETTNT